MEPVAVDVETFRASIANAATIASAALAVYLAVASIGTVAITLAVAAGLRRHGGGLIVALTRYLNSRARTAERELEQVSYWQKD
jgi:hypothetical protein